MQSKPQMQFMFWRQLMHDFLSCKLMHMQDRWFLQGCWVYCLY